MPAGLVAPVLVHPSPLGSGTDSHGDAGHQRVRNGARRVDGEDRPGADSSILPAHVSQSVGQVLAGAFVTEALRPAAVAVVDDAHLWGEADAHPRRPDAPAPFHVFDVDEEGLIEKT